MYYRKCPNCGAHLDPDERCDCSNKGEAPLLQQKRPRVKVHIVNLPVQAQKVKTVGVKSMSSKLQELRTSRNIPQKDMVAVVKGLYPKYDKTMQSKVERESEYGIQLKPDALAALFATFAPECIDQADKRRKDRHRLTCRISCRLENDEYELLQQLLKDTGYGTIQDWLRHIVTQYLNDQKEQ